jgi:hypothetical protein
MTTAPSLPLLMMRDTIGLFVLLIRNHSIIVHVEACSASFSSQSRTNSIMLHPFPIPSAMF